MRTFWIVQAGIGAAAIGAFAALGVACSGTIVSTGTGIGSDDCTSIEISTCTSTSTETSTPPSCYECACVRTAGDAPPGCADTCDNGGMGSAILQDFCNNAPALSMCQMCIAQRCGVDDPTMCN